MTPTKKTAQKTPSINPKDHYGEDHEKLLLIAHKNLPRVLVEQLHADTPLNEALAELAKERHKLIEQKIKEDNINKTQAAIWRAIPDLKLTHNGFPAPEIELGVTLYNRLDKYGIPKNIPDALCIADFVIDMWIPKWSVGAIAKNRKKTISKPIDGLKAAGVSQQVPIRIVGIVIPEKMTLGVALKEIEKLGAAGKIDCIGRRGSPTIYTLCVIQREELFDVLSEKVDVMMVKGKDLHFDFGYLLNAVTVDLKPIVFDQDVVGYKPIVFDVLDVGGTK